MKIEDLYDTINYLNNECENLRRNLDSLSKSSIEQEQDAKSASNITGNQLVQDQAQSTQPNNMQSISQASQSSQSLPGQSIQQQQSKQQTN